MLNMSGTFAVAGTMRITGRGLVAYGDLVTGDVRPGELLVIPLNRSTTVSAVIRSVEAVDGTATGSHVGLLLGEDDLEIDMLHALDLEGETLTIATADVDVYAGRADFDEAKRRLINLLVHVQWPQEIAWVDESDITSWPQRVFIFLRRGQYEPEPIARAKYEAAIANCPAVQVGAVGIARGRTLAAVWPIHELGQGEHMFIEQGVKINVPATQPRVTLTSSRLRWWLIQRAYRKWIERRDAALGTTD